VRLGPSPSYRPACGKWIMTPAPRPLKNSPVRVHPFHHGDRPNEGAVGRPPQRAAVGMKLRRPSPPQPEQPDAEIFIVWCEVFCLCFPCFRARAAADRRRPPIGGLPKKTDRGKARRGVLGLAGTSSSILKIRPGTLSLAWARSWHNRRGAVGMSVCCPEKMPFEPGSRGAPARLAAPPIIALKSLGLHGGRMLMYRGGGIRSGAL